MMRIEFTLVRNDPAEWKKIQSRVRPLLKNPRAKVGFVGEDAAQDHGGITMAELAAVHEFGSPKNGIPERSFIRSTLNTSRDRYALLLRPLLAKLMEGKISIRKVLSMWAIQAAKDIRGRIYRGAAISPPLSKETLRARRERTLEQHRQKSIGAPAGKSRRGPSTSQRPLLDTRQLVKAIGWKVMLSGVEGVQS